MNGYIAIGLILIIIGVYLMSNRKDTPKIIEDKNFCVKVKPFLEDSYCIVFSNDGFSTEIEYEETLSEFEFGHTAIFYSKDEAIKKSKTLKSYNQCISHNKIVQEKTDNWHKKQEAALKQRTKTWVANQEKRKKEEVIITCNGSDKQTLSDNNKSIK